METSAGVFSYLCRRRGSVDIVEDFQRARRELRVVHDGGRDTSGGAARRRGRGGDGGRRGSPPGGGAGQSGRGAEKRAKQQLSTWSHY